MAELKPNQVVPLSAFRATMLGRHNTVDMFTRLCTAFRITKEGNQWVAHNEQEFYLGKKVYPSLVEMRKDLQHR